MTVPAPHFASRVADRILTVLAIAGGLVGALALISALSGITIVLFASGSMSPTIPAGAAAIVRQIPASDIAVGDVVTVERPGALPITHRVTAVTAVAGDTATFTMRGDANESEDPEPYTATRVRVVLASAPGVAAIVQVLKHPYTIGVLTALVTVTVVLSLWPRRSDEEGPARAERQTKAE